MVFFFWIVLDSYLRTNRDASFWTPPAVGGAIMEFFFSFLILSAFKLIDRMTSATNEM